MKILEPKIKLNIQRFYATGYVSGDIKETSEYFMDTANNIRYRKYQVSCIFNPDDRMYQGASLPSKYISISVPRNELMKSYICIKDYTNTNFFINNIKASKGTLEKTGSSDNNTHVNRFEDVSSEIAIRYIYNSDVSNSMFGDNDGFLAVSFDEQVLAASVIFLNFDLWVATN